MSINNVSQEIRRLLPEEQYKRIREAILLAYGGATNVANNFRTDIQQQTALANGILNQGTVAFSSTTQATLTDFAWVIDRQIFQKASQSFTVTAPNATHPRTDYFYGNADGQIVYAAGILTAQGVSLMPSIPQGAIILAAIQRNPNGTNVAISIDQSDITGNLTATRVPVAIGPKTLADSIIRQENGAIYIDGFVYASNFIKNGTGGTGGTGGGGSGIVTWENIQEKPTVFPTSWDIISGKPTVFAPSAHTHTWGEISDKPSIFPTNWSNVADKPTIPTIGGTENYILKKTAANTAGNSIIREENGAIIIEGNVTINGFTFSNNFIKNGNGGTGGTSGTGGVVTWENVQNKPENFPTTWNLVANKPTTFAPSAHTHTWEDITGKPSTFAPSAHTHAISEVTGLQDALNGKLGTTLSSAQIFVGSSANLATARTLSLSATAGTFGLSNTGVLTFPNASNTTRGLLTSADWNTFNNKVGGSGTSNVISMWSGATSLTNSVLSQGASDARIITENSINGIARLAVVNANTGTSAVAFNYASTTGNRYLGFIVGGANRTGTTAGLSNASLAELQSGASDITNLLIHAGGNYPMVFAINNAERMRIASNGNVGIGTTNALARLEVNGGVSITSDANGIPAGLNGLHFTFTNNISRIFSVHNQVAWRNLEVYANQIDLITQGTSRLIALPNGRILINSTSDNGVGQLQVTGNITATNFIKSSDIRLKSEIMPITNWHEAIMNIEGKSYVKNDRKELGFIAQDVEKYFPELVTYDNNGFLSMDYDGMIPVLWNAVREEMSELDKLKLRVSQLETELNNLKNAA